MPYFSLGLACVVWAAAGDGLAGADRSDTDLGQRLRAAAFNGKTASISKVLRANPHIVDAKDKYGQTALMLSSSNGWSSAVELLLSSSRPCAAAVGRLLHSSRFTAAASDHRLMGSGCCRPADIDRLLHDICVRPAAVWRPVWYICRSSRSAAAATEHTA